MEYSTDDLPSQPELVTLYESVGWTAYTARPAHLMQAVENSSFVVTARVGTELVGLLRAISDDVAIVYVQDVLVAPHQQGQGVGRDLLKRCFERFAHVRQRVLLTDDEERQHRLYRSVGMRDVALLGQPKLHAFVAMPGLT